MQSPLVTVIIPVYNTKQFLQRCLDSVLAQTYSNIEVLAVNDGSFDGSRRILERTAERDSRLRVIDQPNQGQGVARNRAIDEASGDFVLFVDADDFIEARTLDITVARALKDESDFVHFDWKLASRVRHRPAAYNYFNIRNIWKKSVLLGAECDELMDTVSFFTVTSLYRKSFLDKNEIRYGEGYVYEDNPFYVLAANKAQKVSLVHAPLYVIQPHGNSTTQTDSLTDKHYVGHIAAIRETLSRLDIRTDATITYFARYNLQKFMEYFSRRVPQEFRKQYAQEFVDAFSTVKITLDPSIPVNRYLRFCVNNDVFLDKKYATFYSVVASWHKFVPSTKRALTKARKKYSKSIFGKKRSNVVRETVVPQQSTVSYEGALLFLGFDFRYTGNSRFLFEQMTSDPRFDHHPRFFVTDDTRVPESQRISPSAASDLDKALRTAAVVISESWIPQRFPKPNHSIWVQLWHGTPFKRVLFDSNELRIINRRIEHKVTKHRDIQRWDFLLSDSDTCTEKFETAFLFPPSRIIQGGYPRVKYLIDNVENVELKDQIRSQLGIPEGKKVVLYAPTWRDYNYGDEQADLDFDYALNLGQLSDSLGEDFVVLFHDHDYLSTRTDQRGERCIDASSVDTQELLLISDALVSDYSSVIFDAFAIQVPVVLYCPDTEKFNETRGVYDDIWEELKPLVVERPEEVSDRILASTNLPQTFEVNPKFVYSQKIDLLHFFDKLDLNTLNRNW